MIDGSESETVRIQVQALKSVHDLLIEHKDRMKAASMAEVIRRHAQTIETLRKVVEDGGEIDVKLLIGLLFPRED